MESKLKQASQRFFVLDNVRVSSDSVDCFYEPNTGYQNVAISFDMIGGILQTSDTIKLVLKNRQCVIFLKEQNEDRWVDINMSVESMITYS